ncbi:MAG TPA: methyltransferase domain-containing protein [Anaerolineae bacterium]
MSQLAQAIFGQRAAFYTTSSAHTDKAVLDRVIELARPQPTSLVLDVGTGTGHTAFALAPHVREVIATDFTPAMLFEGRSLKAESRMQNVEFRIADAHDLPFGDEMFDIVTCRRAAHHFADAVRALSEMQRVLKPHGRLVIDDRSVPEDDFVDATLNRLDVLHDRSHVREYRPSEWERMLREADFVVETIEPYIRHRPLSALTEKAEPEDAATIEAMVAALNEAQRAAMNVVDKDGETYMNHWFVMIAATKVTSGQ